MSDEDRLDAIVVGAGPAGTAAALTLARAGKQVALIERGTLAGSKNVTGGRLYTHALKALFPENWKDAPLERRVTREVVSMMTPTSAVSMAYASPDLGENSYTVIRARLDAWLAEQAEAAGAMVAPGVKVDELILEGGKVVGVRAGGDEMLANVVIVAEGANCLLPRQAGLRTKEIDPHHTATGVKMVFELPRNVLQDRFALNDEEGQAQLFAGSLTRGYYGGGFLYTNRETVSLGLVLSVAAMREHKEVDPLTLMQDLLKHPAVAPLLTGAKPIEYSAHLVPEGGYDAITRLFGDGILVAGDAAGLVMNLGYTVRGMDFAMASGVAAAETAIEAADKNDASAAFLASYKTRLENSFVLRDLAFYRGAHGFMSSSTGMFGAYPAIASDLMKSLFIVDPTQPLKHAKDKARAAQKGKASVFRLAMDGWKGGNTL